MQMSSMLLNPKLTGDIYSTSEVKTNKKWINGKPIYRKVYTGNCAKNTAITLDTLSNIDKIVGCSGWATSMYDWSWAIPNYHSDGYSVWARYGTTNHNLQLSFGTLFESTGTYNLTVEYTKTTD